MALVKAHEVDAYLKAPKKNHRTLLIYGPDIGLVSERATLLAKTCGVALDDPFSTIRLDADDAAADPQRVADEAHTVSMFGGDRLIWIRGNTQKNLAKALQSVLDVPPSDALIIIEAGDLKKSAPLRTRIEKSSNAVALPCYQDQTKAINAIIDEETRLSGLSIEPDARTLLKELLGGDRLASRGEVQKLCLFATGNQIISISDVQDIVGDAAALAVDTVIDAASTGDVATMEHMFKRLIAQGTSIFQVVAAAQRHFQMLHQAKCAMESNRQPATSVIGGMRPPVNFQRRDKIARALSVWPRANLERLLERLEKVSLESRANSALDTSLASTALLAIAIEARAHSRR